MKDLKVVKVEFLFRGFRSDDIIFVFTTNDGEKHTYYNGYGVTNLKNNRPCDLDLGQWINTLYWKEVKDLYDRDNFKNEMEYDKYGNYVDWEFVYDINGEVARDKNNRCVERPVLKNVFEFLDKFISWLIEESDDYDGENSYDNLKNYDYETLDTYKVLRTIIRK